MFLFDILTEEVKPLVKKLSEFEYQFELIGGSIFGDPGMSGISNPDAFIKIDVVSMRWFLAKIEAFD